MIGQEGSDLPDFEEKLNSILSDPSAMAQIMGLARSLDLSPAGEEPPPAEPAAPIPLPGGADPAMLQNLLPLLTSLTDSAGSDERLALLHALGPFLKPERREKMERALQTARLIRAGKALLSAVGDSHV